MAPAPQNRNGTGNSEIANPPDITSARPRATFIIPRVGMKGCGRRRLVSSRPLITPRAVPAASAAGIASHGGVPAFSMRATSTQQKPRIDPTERSMPAVMMTASCPSPSRAFTADCRNTFVRLSMVRKCREAKLRVRHMIASPSSGLNRRRVAAKMPSRFVIVGAGLNSIGPSSGGQLHDALVAGIGARELPGDAPAVHDQDTIRQAENLFQLRGGEQDGRPASGERANQGVDLALGADIDAASGFVQQEHGGIGEQPPG